MVEAPVPTAMASGHTASVTVISPAKTTTSALIEAAFSVVLAHHEATHFPVAKNLDMPSVGASAMIVRGCPDGAKATSSASTMSGRF